MGLWSGSQRDLTRKASIVVLFTLNYVSPYHSITEEVRIFVYNNKKNKSLQFQEALFPVYPGSQEYTQSVAGWREEQTTLPWGMEDGQSVSVRRTAPQGESYHAETQTDSSKKTSYHILEVKKSKPTSTLIGGLVDDTSKVDQNSASGRVLRCMDKKFKINEEKKKRSNTPYRIQKSKIFQYFYICLSV